MLVFIIRRSLQSVVVLLVMSVLVFVGVYAVGNPIDILINPQADQQDRERAIAALGLDKSLPAQYLSFLSGAFHGDLGRSFVHATSALGLILERMPATLELAAAAMLIASVLGIPLGLWAGLRPASVAGRTIMAGSILGFSLPTFWVAILLVEFVAGRLQWLPAGGIQGFSSYILPGFTLGWFVVAGLMRLLRSGMLEVLDSEYVKLARVKGLGEGRVVWMHALKNALIPVITFAGIYFAILVTTAIVVETVFAWPGIGFLAYNAIIDQDLILLQAIVFLVAIFVVVINIMIDILYRAIDPRIQLV